VLLPATSPDEAVQAAEKLLGRIRVDAAVTVESSARIRPTASIGIRRIDPGATDDGDALLVDADVAMYDAKETGRDRVSVAGTGSAHPEKIRARLTWSQRVREALDRPEGEGFVLYEQPILSLRTGVVDHGELLIRMRGREHRDLVPPGRFLYIAERFGLIGALDRWVIARAIRLAATRQAAGSAMGVHVNLSGGSIGDRGVMDFIAAEVRNAPVDPSRLTFEVTETAAIVDMQHARTLARTLSELGCRFALDDFGAGFGSFYYLKHLPFDTVKIDGDFVKALAASRTDALIVRSMHEIASGLGKVTVAEFVQDDASLRILREIGVDHAQGFHVGAPAPVTEWLP
jgi:EAL domain-containing protein (putative c-di-GMP-specific phosphodiesterase class I)